jgi:acyl-coenzyme A thioesterase PaaI-like protein
MPGPESIVMDKWNRAKGSAVGRWLFSRAVGRFAPYTGTIGARIQELQPGRSVVTMRDRKAVRNHLNSVHAVALTNLVELCGSLAIIASLPPETRMIPIRLETDFVKKGRGLMTAESTCAIPSSSEKAELPATVVVRDDSGDEIARGRVTVVIGAND